VLLGLGARLLPGLLDPGIEIQSDGAYHARLVAEVARAHALPAHDELSNAPFGRDVAALLPAGLYQVGAAFHRAADALEPPRRADSGDEARRLDRHLRWLMALAGALTVLPVYFAARALGAGASGALLAAALLALLPAHLHRTFDYWVRYDALGALLIATHWALLLRALGHPRGRGAWSVLAAIAGFAALATWRVALIVPVLEAVFVLGWVAWRGADRALAMATVPSALAAFGAGLALRYLAVTAYAATWPSLLVLASALAAALALWKPIGRRAPARAAVVLAVAGAAILIGARHAAPYESIGRLLAARVAGHAGDPITALMLNVEELFALPPLYLFAPQQLFASGLVLIAAPFLFWPRRGPRAPALAPAGTPSAGPMRPPSPAPALFAWLLVAFAALTLLFYRDKVLLAPLVAILVGCAWSASTTRPRAWRALIAACALATAVAGVWLAATRHSRLDPDLAATLDFVREHTPAGARVVSAWEYGYDVQRRASRATLVDGLLESAQNQRDIVALDAAFMARGPDSLAALCRARGAEWVLVPPPDRLYTVAVVTRESFLPRLEAGERLDPADLDRALIQLMLADGPVGPFAPVFARGEWKLYRLAPS
jgi:hypothetical protein